MIENPIHEKDGNFKIGFILNIFAKYTARAVMLILFVATRWLPAAATLLVVLFLTFPTMKIDLLL